MLPLVPPNQIAQGLVCHFLLELELGLEVVHEGNQAFAATRVDCQWECESDANHTQDEIELPRLRTRTHQA